MIYFDSNANHFALDSTGIKPYQVPCYNGALVFEGLSGDGRLALTDGSSYFAVPPGLLQQGAQTSPLDVKRLQDFFFSPPAVAAAMGVKVEEIDPTDRASLTYGTTGASSLHKALERIRAGSGDRFLDIGSGCGLPVLLASHVVDYAVGVEVVPSMVDFARQAAATWNRTNVDFIAANIRDIDVSQFDIVYVAATTLTDQLRLAIGDKLEQLRPGAVVLSLTYAFAHEHLVLLDTFKSRFSWWNTGTVTEHQFFVHIRRAL